MIIFYGILLIYLAYFILGFKVKETVEANKVKSQMIMPREDFGAYMLDQLSTSADKLQAQATNGDITPEEWAEKRKALYVEATAIESGQVDEELDYLHDYLTRQAKWTIFKARMGIRLRQIAMRALVGYPLLWLVLEAIGIDYYLPTSLVFVLVCTALAMRHHYDGLAYIANTYAGMSKEKLGELGYESLDEIVVDKMGIILGVLATQVPFFLMLLYLGW